VFCRKNQLEKYELVCGLETHIELSTKSKMFCPCKLEFGARPNVNCCPVCTGAPGALPIINQRAIRFAIMMGLALSCRINLFSQMERKNYFYPDLPKSYQISQNENPLCTGGYVVLESGKRIRVNHIHIEEDAGKIKSEDGGIYIDYNRGGTPLIEIVSEPDIRGVRELCEYISFIQTTARYLGISDVRMQEGSLRCDVNVSIRLKESERLGVRVEIKNMNSIAFMAKAVEYEFKRQVGVIESGEKLFQETRRYDDSLNITQSMREKENVSDYLYFPDPDVQDIYIEKSEVEKIEKSMPELPNQKLKRYTKDFGISKLVSEILVKYSNPSKFLDKSSENADQAVIIANWIIGPVFSFLKTESAKENFKIGISCSEINKLASLVIGKKISSSNAKKIIIKSLENNLSLSELIKDYISSSISFDIEKICEEAILNNKKAARDYINGKEKALQPILGTVMAKTKGQANIVAAKDIIVNKLKLITKI
jgi:aspartyl-tRNA(Asn)/glutamyl-tRNA(Gln) amidotransferase subunit B